MGADQSHQREQLGDAGVAMQRLGSPRICRLYVAEMISLSEYLSWQRQEPASLTAGRRMERVPCKAQKVLEVGTRCPLWNQHVSTRLARWLELQLSKSGSFSTTGLGGLSVTVRKRKEGRQEKLGHGGTTKSSLCAPPLPPQSASLSPELRADSRKLRAFGQLLPVF